MTHLAPSSMLLWAILAAIEQVYLIIHLWRYDRLECLKWNSGRKPGAFKRVMTYGYLLSIPLMFVYTATMATVKYQEGYMDLTVLGHGVIPKPHQFWTKQHQGLILPALICFAVCWSVEMTSHFEELAFWLFLLHQGSNQRDWFRSWEFRGWVVASTIAIVGMPTLTVALRDDPHHCEAWVFFAGGMGSLLTTLWFLVVLWKFPAFLRRVRAEGASADVVVRLATFDELNRLRVGFRFMFVLPLLILAVDGILPGKKHLNENSFVVDLLAMCGGLGCIISSTLTLLIFFPRSVSREAGYRAKSITSNSTHQQQAAIQSRISTAYGQNNDQPDYQKHHVQYARASDPYNPASPGGQEVQMVPMQGSRHGGVGSGPAAWDSVHHEDNTGYNRESYPAYGYSEDKVSTVPSNTTVLPLHSKPVRPPRPAGLGLHPMILQYTSPIDLMDSYAAASPRARSYTPSRF